MEEWMSKMPGRFLVVDGPDGAGKTTQLTRLADELRSAGVPALSVRDPGGTRIGDRIRQILLDPAHTEMAIQCELLLYMASRAQLVAELIRPALARGECVLSDRYISASVAYQGAGGADPAIVQTLGEIAVQGLWPDLTLVLDIDAETGLGRVGRTEAVDRMESKAVEFHRHVRDSFLQQANQHPERFVRIDAAGSEDDVAGRIRTALAGWTFAEAPRA